VCRASNQCTLSTLFASSQVQEHESCSPVQHTEAPSPKSQEEHQPDALVEFEEAPLREMIVNNSQPDIVLKEQTTMDDEMLERTSYMNMT
jgi:hypothetical protein